MDKLKETGDICVTYLGMLALLPFTMALTALWTVMPRRECVLRRKREARKDS